MPIAPNTAVSVFATLSKSSLLLPVAECLSQLKWLHFKSSHRLGELELFDKASRGPLGALQFLWNINVGALIGSMGAMIAIAALAVDPFAQQVIKFQARNVSLGNDTASFGISLIYDSGMRTDEQYGGYVARRYHLRIHFNDMMQEWQGLHLR